MLWAKAETVFTPARATAVAALIFAAASWGDVLTTADATFTLFYLIPQVVAVWFSGLRTAYVFVVLSVISSAAVDYFVGQSPPRLHVIAWNSLADAGLYLIFVHALAALKARFKLESELRMDALNQLRHAERLTTIGKLASGVAHEIGTPLNVISGYAELLTSGKISGDDAKDSGKILLEQSERVAKIVHQLLDFSRRGGTRVASTDLGELTTTTCRLLETLAKKSGTEITSQVSPIRANVNRSEIQQVLTNLVTNAIQSMPNGGRVVVQVTGERARSPQASRATTGDYAVIRVRDAGTGISPDILPRIFDPFFTTKDVGQGTGLGLSITYGIVSDHGGWISVDTKFGEGTTFSIFLPRITH